MEHSFNAISDECQYDSVVVFDESYLHNNNSQDFNIFCGVLDTQLPEFISKTNSVYVQFVSDFSRGDEGFEAEIKFTYGTVVYFIIFFFIITYNYFSTF